MKCTQTSWFLFNLLHSALDEVHLGYIATMFKTRKHASICSWLICLINANGSKELVSREHNLKYYVVNYVLSTKSLSFPSLSLPPFLLSSVLLSSSISFPSSLPPSPTLSSLSPFYSFSLPTILSLISCCSCSYSSTSFFMSSLASLWFLPIQWS